MYYAQYKYLWITWNNIISLVCMTEMFTKLQCNTMKQIIQILPHLLGLWQPDFTLLSAWTPDVLRYAYCSPTSISVAKVWVLKISTAGNARYTYTEQGNGTPISQLQKSIQNGSKTQINVRPETMKREKQAYWRWFRALEWDFLDKTQKARTSNPKIGKQDYIKWKCFCPAKERTSIAETKHRLGAAITK